MKKGRDRDLMEEIENAIHVEHPLTLPTDHKSSSGETNSVKIKDTKFPNVIMNTAGQTSQSPSISGSVPSFPPPTYGEAYKSYRPRLQKQESLPLRGMSLGAVNTSQSMPFNQPKLLNGKVDYTSTESKLNSNSFEFSSITNVYTFSLATSTKIM